MRKRAVIFHYLGQPKLLKGPHIDLKIILHGQRWMLTQNQYFFSRIQFQQQFVVAWCTFFTLEFHCQPKNQCRSSSAAVPPIIAPNCVHKLRCTIQKHRRTFSMSYCTSAGSSMNTADHPDWSCLQCAICIAKYFISYYYYKIIMSFAYVICSNFFNRI